MLPKSLTESDLIFLANFGCDSGQIEEPVAPDQLGLLRTFDREILKTCFEKTSLLNFETKPLFFDIKGQAVQEVCNNILKI